MPIVFRGLNDCNLVLLLVVPMSDVTRDLYSCTILNEGHPIGAHFGEISITAHRLVTASKRVSQVEDSNAEGTGSP